ncbi:MAG: GerW family sporulation protein [Clostridia bacterium]|nr:GerW family sporulation protein [Clostridia bacterium]
MSHPIENIMQSSMEHVKRLADVNTVIGDPIISDDSTMILPVSKVSLGMLVGGGEYAASAPIRRSSMEFDHDGNYPFVGASAVGMSLTPLAFLAVHNGTVRVLPAKQDCASDRLVDLIPQMIDTAERLIKELACGCRCEKHDEAGNKEGSRDQARNVQNGGSAKNVYEPYGEFD